MQALAETSQNPYRISVSHAFGSWIVDTSGKKYLDFISGIAVSALGHNHPRIRAAIHQQTDKHLHTMVYGEFEHDVVSHFASKLVEMMPSSLNTVYPVNSGTEAVEAALKLSKRSTGRYEICAFKGSYHGNSQGSLSISWNPSKRLAFLPLMPGIRFLNWNQLPDLETITQNTAAVIIETIQGDAGVRIPDIAFLKALRLRCSVTGTLLIMDEIQCGFGRTGKFNAFEHYGITPDILVVGKALGGGLPIGALISNRDLINLFTVNPALGHITTFGGHPLPTAAGLAALEVLISENIISGVEEKGLFIEQSLNGLPAISEFRRKGLMIAVMLKDENSVNKLILNCKEKGLLLYWFLSVRNGFRIAPPLNITFEDLNWACEILTEEIRNL